MKFQTVFDRARVEVGKLGRLCVQMVRESNGWLWLTLLCAPYFLTPAFFSDDEGKKDSLYTKIEAKKFVFASATVISTVSSYVFFFMLQTFSPDLLKTGFLVYSDFLKWILALAFLVFSRGVTLVLISVYAFLREKIQCAIISKWEKNKKILRNVSLSYFLIIASSYAMWFVLVSSGLLITVLSGNLEIQQKVTSWISENPVRSVLILLFVVLLGQRWGHVKRVALEQLYPSGFVGGALAFAVDVVLCLVSIAIYFGLGWLWMKFFS